MIDEFLRSILPTNRPRSRGDGRGALWAMYDLVPDSTFSFKRGGEKSSEKCASRPLCATTDSTGHASRCIVRSGVQRGGHPGPYGPIATISDPGPFPGKGKGLEVHCVALRCRQMAPLQFGAVYPYMTGRQSVPVLSPAKKIDPPHCAKASKSS